jgi:hypothetical protein
MVYDPEYGLPYRAGDGPMVAGYDAAIAAQRRALAAKPAKGDAGAPRDDIRL